MSSTPIEFGYDTSYSRENSQIVRSSSSENDLDEFIKARSDVKPHLVESMT